MPQCNNVLRVNASEEREDYRSAVAEILRNIQADNDLTLLEISERIDVSLGTVSNAANKRGDLNPVFLSRLAKAWGATYLNPFARLSGGIVSPLEGQGADILPTLLATGTAIAEARSPSSPGGISETLREQLGYLPYLRRLQREIGEQICAIEQRRDAA